MKLLVDMNLSPNWISVLRDSGWEAVHWSVQIRTEEVSPGMIGKQNKWSQHCVTRSLSWQRALC